MSADLAVLRALAQRAATITSLAAVIGGERWVLDGWPQEAVDFLAEFDPPTVLAILDRVEAAESKVARVEALADEWVATADRCDHRLASCCSTCVGRRIHARDIRAALAPETPEAGGA